MQNLEEYLFTGGSMLSIQEEDKKTFLEIGAEGPGWLRPDEPFQCIIKSPKKETKFKGMKSFIVYQITPTFSNKTVSRRYKHFDWLHDRLLEKFSMCIVPSLPGKQVTGRFEEDFIQDRMRQLQLWIDRLCRHPVIAHSDVFHHFLSCTDEKNWKNGKRKAEKDNYQGIKFCHTVQIPAVKLDPIDVEIEIDDFWKAVKSMDDSTKHLMTVCDDNTKKHQTSFSKEYSKVGTSLQTLAKSFDYDKSPSSVQLTSAIKHTGQTYEDISKMHEDQPKQDMAHLMEGLHEHKGILTTLPDVLYVYKAACTKIEENAGRLPDNEIQEVQERANVIAYATVCEINHFNECRTGDFRRYMQEYLIGQIHFHTNITQRLEKTLEEYDRV